MDEADEGRGAYPFSNKIFTSKVTSAMLIWPSALRSAATGLYWSSLILLRMMFTSAVTSAMFT